MNEKIKYKKIYKKGTTEDILKDIENTFFNQDHESQIKIDSLDICHMFGYLEEKDKENKKLKQTLEKIATYVTHLLDENMIASKYGQEILTMIVEVMKNE